MDRLEGSERRGKELLNRRLQRDSSPTAAAAPPVAAASNVPSGAAAGDATSSANVSPRGLRRGRSRRSLLPSADDGATPRQTNDDDERRPLVQTKPSGEASASARNASTAALLFDPQNPEAVQEALERLGGGAADYRMVYHPLAEVAPAWVRRWTDLCLYASSTAPPLSAMESMGVPASIKTLTHAIRRMQADLSDAERLRAEIEVGMDGGLFGIGHREVETPQRLPEDAFWTEPGVAARYVDDLVQQLRASLDVLIQAADTMSAHQAANGSACADGGGDYGGVEPLVTGIDGTQELLLCTASHEAQDALLQHVVLEASADVNKQWARRFGPSAVVSRLCGAINRLANVPIVHDKFVIPEDVSQTMDPLAIRDPDMLTSPQSVAVRDTVRRSYTIHVPFLRFRDRIDLTSEQQLASQLLDAYEQYQLLTGNLKPDLKSRSFYRQLLSTLDAQQRVLQLQQQQQGGDGVAPLQTPSGASELKRAYHQQNLAHTAAVRDLYNRAVDAERACMKQMIACWRQITQLRESQGYASVRLSFGLRRHASTTGTTVGGGDNDGDGAADVLQYAPVLTDADLPSAPPMQATPGTVNGSGSEAAAPPATLSAMFDAAPRHHPSQTNERLKISVFARTSSAVPPQLVGSTAIRSMNSTCTVHFNETFEMRTQHDPTELILQVVRDEHEVLASVRIPASTSAAAMLLPFQTGSFFTSPESGATKETCGVISVATTWTTSEGLSMEAIERMFLRGEADPLDPRNEKFVLLLRKFYMESADDERQKSTQQLYREGEGGLFLPLPPALGARHELLRRRWRIACREECAADEVEAKLVDCVVPLDDNQTKRMFRDLRKEVDASKAAAIARDRAAAATDTAASVLSDAPHRQWQQKIKNVKLMHQSKRRLADHEKLAKHLVLPPLPTFSGVFQYILDSLSPKSNLNPRRENRADVSAIDRTKLTATGGGGNSHILVHVMKAANLPMRNDGSELEPLVEVKFVSFSSCGRTEAGCNPSWFESLKIRFEPPDFEEDTLALIDDMIVVSVYDRIRINLPPTTATLGATPDITHFRMERRLLGTVKIPFYTLYTTEKASIEGLYTVVTPRWIMGYHVPHNVPSTLQLYIALNPPLRKPKKPKRFEFTDLGILPVTLELHQVHCMAMQWRQKVDGVLEHLILENPNAVWRDPDPFVPNAVGDATLICRYLLPHGGPPPPTVRSVPNALRFVSLMRFEVDMVTWGDRDVWSTNAEFLAKGCGDYEELALLLVHFLRHLAPTEQTLLIIGKGNHYHEAAFVLHMVEGYWKIIDPRTGTMCDAHDANCELAEVSMAVTHDQVYANAQLSGTPYRMIWDLNDTRYWLPMLAPNLPPALQAAMLEPIQREHLTFRPPTEGQALMIEDGLKKAVKKALKSWRNDRQPTYQERVGTILREVLEDVERERRECANYQQSFVDDAHTKALEEFAGEYIPIGNPVQGFYQPEDTGFANILESVRETAVHRVGTDAVRFALATYAYPFTEDVVAIWVYLVALVPRREDR